MNARSSIATRWLSWASRWAVALLVAAICAACTRTPSRPTDTPSPSPAAAGVFVYATDTDVGGLDPAFTVDPASTRVARQIFEGLTAPLPTQPGVAPALATKWSSDDNRSWRFELRPGVVFHDGTEFTSAVVCANIDRWTSWVDDDLAKARLWRSYFRNNEQSLIQECAPAGDSAVTIVLTRPLPGLPDILSLPAFAMQSPQAFGRPTPVGTGPFTYLSHEDGVRVVLGRYDKYWGTKATIAKAVVQVVPDTKERIKGVARGSYAAADTIQPADAAEANNLGVQLVDRNRPSVLYLGMNQRNSELAKHSVRDALAVGFDPQALVGTAVASGSPLADQLVPPGLAGHRSELDMHLDKQRARALLAKEGYTAANPLVLRLAYPSGVTPDFLPAPEEAFAAIRDEFAAINVTIQPVAASWGDYLDMLSTPERSGSFDLHLMGWSADVVSTETLITPLFGQPNPQFGFRQPLIHKAVAAARSGADTWARAVDTIADYRPLIPLAHPRSQYYVAKKVAHYPNSLVAAERWNDVILVT